MNLKQGFICSVAFLLGTFLVSCASTSKTVRKQLAKESLIGEWRISNQKSQEGWLDISCEGELSLRTTEAEIEGGVITKIGKNYFVSDPNPFNDQFTFKTLKDSKTGQKRRVITVHALPESNILKVMHAFSTIMGKDNTLVFEKNKNYQCL